MYKINGTSFELHFIIKVYMVTLCPLASHLCKTSILAKSSPLFRFLSSQMSSLFWAISRLG